MIKLPLIHDIRSKYENSTLLVSLDSFIALDSKPLEKKEDSRGSQNNSNNKNNNNDNDDDEKYDEKNHNAVLLPTTFIVIGRCC